MNTSLRHEHVSILGCGHGIPRQLPPGEVWYPNFKPHRPDILKRLTCAFQIHPVSILHPAELWWLLKTPVPIFTLRASRAFPQSRPYPLATVREVLPGPLCSSFDYMMALAILVGYKSILLAGIHLQRGVLRERLIEHVSLAYWVGLARGVGTEVEIAPRSFLLHAPWRYGYDYHRERRWGQQLALEAHFLKQLDDGLARTKPRSGIIPSGLLAPEKEAGNACENLCRDPRGSGSGKRHKSVVGGVSSQPGFNDVSSLAQSGG